MTRLAITLGDPRGIGPEIVARALEQPLEAAVTLVGAGDQIEGIPAAQRVAVGSWKLGSGERPDDRARTIRAGRLAGHARSEERRVGKGCRSWGEQRAWR